MLLQFKFEFKTTPNTDLLNLKLYDSQLTKAYDIIAIADSWLMADEELESPPRHVHIGIVDTGIDTSHPEFLGVNLFGDAIMEPGTSNSCGFVQSHGTEVAGVIGANNFSATEVLPADSPHMNGIIAGLRDADYALSVYAFSTFDTIQAKIEKGISEGARVFLVSVVSVARLHTIVRVPPVLRRPFSTRRSQIESAPGKIYLLTLQQ